MFETFSSDNMQVQNDLAIRYSVTPVELTEESGEKVTKYDVRRVATKQYSFVGMTREAARQCASAKVAQYTRPYYVVSGNDSALLTNLMAEISSRHTNGHMYQVDVSVNEQEVRRVQQVPIDPAELFPMRDYDGDAGGIDIEISVAYVTSSTFGLEATSTIKGFNTNLMGVQVKTSESETAWTDYGVGPGPLPLNGHNLLYVRGTWGQIVSNVVTVRV